MPADIVLKNANIITMDGELPAGSFVAIRGNKIAATGDSRQLESTLSPGTRVIDCHGATVLPGFNDAHCHIFPMIRKLLSVDLGPSAVASIADIKAVLRCKAESIPPGQWISGTSLDPFYLAEKRLPTRRELDDVVPIHPVVLSHRSLHACVLNSLALSLAGITGETPEPPWGLIDRDLDSGEPNGILYEMLGYIRENVMPPLTDEQVNRAIALVDRNLLSCGITSVQDATVANDFARWQRLRGFQETGRLHSRVTMMVGREAWPDFHGRGLISGSGDDDLRPGPVKLMLTEARGRLQPAPEELEKMALDAHRAGFRLAIHAVEPGTVAAAIAVLEYVERESPGSDRRHRIEHCSECPPPLLERLRKLRPVIVTQPPFIYFSGERYLATVPADRQPWLYRIGSFLRAGLTVAASSDAPVVGNSPLVGIYAAVTRRTAKGPLLLPEEGITRRQALAMYTTNAAYASCEEDLKGMISPGKLADLVLLDRDPLSVPADEIKDIKVVKTIIGGKVVWEA